MVSNILKDFLVYYDNQDIDTDTVIIAEKLKTFKSTFL